MVEYFLLGQLDMFPDHFILAIRTFKVATEKGTEKQNTRNAHERIHSRTTGEHMSAFAFYVCRAEGDEMPRSYYTLAVTIMTLLQCFV